MIETFDFKKNREAADALEALGGVVLDPNTGKQAHGNEPTLGDVGIMNRRDARRAGIYSKRRHARGHMAVPKTRGR